jgi:predicted molibdopterin-dependent oxidoreductase YjgC
LITLAFCLVQEVFMSETAKYANVVLPGASFFEKSGTFTNGGRIVQRADGVIAPLADTKTDGQIVSAS